LLLWVQGVTVLLNRAIVFFVLVVLGELLPFAQALSMDELVNAGQSMDFASFYSLAILFL